MLMWDEEGEGRKRVEMITGRETDAKEDAYKTKEGERGGSEGNEEKEGKMRRKELTVKDE